MAALQTQFEPEISAPMILTEQFKDLRGDTVGPGANSKTNNIVDGQGLIIKCAKLVDWGESVGERLKIGHKFTGLVLTAHDLLALLDLHRNTRLALDTDGSGAIRVTKEAPRPGPSSGAVRATETGIDRDFVHTYTEMFFQVLGKKLVRFN